jgi:tetratricopeptide (TPR) repeat protein/tRNA A-37 threonylcarbamoyl transferase component Bud32
MTKARTAMDRNDRPRPVPPTRAGSPAEPDLLLDDLWERGEHPDVRAFLAPWREVGLGLDDVLAVLRVDQRWRWLTGERVDVADYFRDFPSLTKHPEAVFELVYSELLIREELGERPDPDDYVGTFPELAERLRLQLEVHEALSFGEIGAIGWTEPPESHPSSEPHVPGYELLGEIGRGGMGVVYKARQIKPNRLIALKMILEGRFASRLDLLRFANEAELVATLDHPNIVPILEVGQHDGLPYFTMPLLAGGSLAAAQPHPAGDPRSVARLVAEVAAAVHHAHQRGILHRDLKPGNILLDEEGRPHVTDFGLAKRVKEGRGLTVTGAILGSPGYMSPEQAAGDPGAVTTASDVYGLGAILYALLTGHAPFEGSSVRETIARLNEEPPEPPSRLNRAVPAPLDQICLKSLEKEPSRRYGTAEALAADLQRWLVGEPISARPEPLAERTWRWVRRRRTAVAAFAAATLAALIGLAIVLAVQVRANHELSAAKDREEARFDLAMEAIKQFHTGVSEDLLLKEPQFHALRDRLLHGAREFFGKLEDLLKAHTDPRSRQAMAQAYDELAALTDMIGSQTEAMELYHRELAIRRGLARDAPADVDALASVGRCLLAEGTLRFRTGHTHEALAAYEEARSLLGAAHRTAGRVRDFRAELAMCDHRTADLLAATGRTAEALAWYRKGRSLREEQERDRPSLTESRSALAESDVAIGILLWRDGHPAEAVAAFEKARALFEALVQARPGDTRFRRQLAHCYNEISFPLHALGKTDEALKAFQGARRILEGLVRDNPNVTEFRHRLAYSESEIGTLLCDTGRWAEALEPYRRAQALLEALAQANPDVAELRNDLARCYSQIGRVLGSLGDPVAALASVEKARLLREALVAANPNVIIFRSNLAVTLGGVGLLKREAGQFAEAAARFRRGITLLDGLPSRTPEDDYNLACYHSSIAGFAGKPGSGITTEEGREEADRAMADLRRAFAGGFRMLSLISFDHDLDPLRSRPDFRMLMMDLTFPDEPFAR